MTEFTSRAAVAVSLFTVLAALGVAGLMGQNTVAGLFLLWCALGAITSPFWGAIWGPSSDRPDLNS